MPSVDEVFSVVAFFILLRETVEASIICGVLLQFLNRSRPRLKASVWWGVFGGIATSIVFGVIFIVLFYVARNNLFAGKNKDLFMGIVCWLAAALISYLGFKMFKFVGWEEKWKRKLTTAAAKRMAEAQKEEEERAAADKAAGLEPGSIRASTETASVSNSGSGNDNTSKLQSKDSAMVLTPPVEAHEQDVRSAQAATDAIERTNSLTKQSGSSTSASDSAAAAKSPNALAASDTCDKVTDAEVDSSLAVMEEGEKIDLTEPTRKEFWQIFFLVWITVTREGIESVVFLGGVGSSVKPQAIPLAGFVGITAGVLLGMFLFYTGKTVKDLKWFLISMGLIVLFIAAGQVGVGVDALTRAGAFGYCSIWLDERPWYMQPLWDTSKCCGDRDDQNKFFALVRAIFGYQDKPTMLETTFYFGYWFIILCVMAYKGWQGSLFDADFKFKQEQKKLEAKRAKEEAALLNADGEQPLALTDSAHTGEIAGVVCADSKKVAEEVEVAIESDAGFTPIAPRPWWRRVLPSKQ